MGVSCVTSDHLTYACTLGADFIDWFGVTLQGVWFVAGCTLGAAAGVALSWFLRRMEA